MKELELTDETFRDGPQSLWKSRMRTLAMTKAAPDVDDVGFQKATLISGASFEAAIHYLREDPWERIRRVKGRMHHTPSSLLVRGRNLFGWRRYSDDVVELFMRVLKRLGFDWMMVFDGLNDMRMIERHIRSASSEGMRTIGMVCYSQSPVHTFEHFRQKAAELASFGVDSIQMADASGILMPEEAKLFIRAGREGIGNRPIQLELACHDLTGQALACYEVAIHEGIDCLSTASSPLAYGQSIPSTSDVYSLAQHAGCNTSIDPSAVAKVDDYFAWIAREEKQPVEHKVRYDPQQYAEYVTHQIPGGMMSHLVGHLSDLGLHSRLPEVLQEAARVRQELGYPVMVTPFSQLVAVQALMNVLEKERYQTVPQELRLYVGGYYGKSPGPIDEEVMDRVLGDEDPVDPTDLFSQSMVADARAKEGNYGSDETLLTKLFLSASVFKQYQLQCQDVIGAEVQSPIVALIGEIASLNYINRVQIKEGY